MFPQLQLMTFPPRQHTLSSTKQLQIRRSACAKAHTKSHIKFQIPRDQPPKRSQRFVTVTVIRSRRITTARITPRHTTQGTLLNTDSSRWVARRMDSKTWNERWTIGDTCSKVLWFDHVMCTELYDHTGDNNGTIKQNTELIIHQHSQSRPNLSMYIKLSTHHNPLA